MEPPSTPGRTSGSATPSQATTAMSPFGRPDVDSPKLRASTLAYGQPRNAAQRAKPETRGDRFNGDRAYNGDRTYNGDRSVDRSVNSYNGDRTYNGDRSLNNSYNSGNHSDRSFEKPRFANRSGNRSDNSSFEAALGSSSSTYLAETPPMKAVEFSAPESGHEGHTPHKNGRGKTTPSTNLTPTTTMTTMPTPSTVSQSAVPQSTVPTPSIMTTPSTAAAMPTPAASATLPTPSTMGTPAVTPAAPAASLAPSPASTASSTPRTPVRSRSHGPVARQVSTPQRSSSSRSANHSRTHSQGYAQQPSEAQARRTPSRTYRHDTAVPGVNDGDASELAPPGAPAAASTPERRRPQKRTSIGPWDFIRSIGAGSMGQVKLAQHRYTRVPAAVKIVPKAFTQRSRDARETNEAKDARVIREAAIGRLLDHPNIARLYDVYSMTGHFYLVFEFINGGQMLDYIIAHGCVKEAQARQFARSIASALDYCHHNSIVHRDLKIENILIADSGEIKLIDFGLSNLFRRDDLLRTFCGSLYFAAPELLNAQPYVGPEIDVWSFGVVLYVLVCGKVPFEDKSMTVLHAKIKRGTVEYPQWLSSLCVDLLSRMLVVNPSERATLAEVMRHPWMNKGYDQYPQSHLPRRVPLTADALDPLVLAEMENMGIGDAVAIERSLRAVLNSADYERAVERWYDRQQLDITDGMASLDSLGSRTLTSASSGGLLPPAPFALSSSSMSYSPELDPLDSFSPEISCYFLTRERMERALLSPAQPPTGLQTLGVPGATASGLPFPDDRRNPRSAQRRTPSPSRRGANGRARSKTLGAAYEGKPAPIINVSHAHEPPAQPAEATSHTAANPYATSASHAASHAPHAPHSPGAAPATPLHVARARSMTRAPPSELTPPPQPAYVSHIPQQAQFGVVTSTNAAKLVDEHNRIVSQPMSANELSPSASGMSSMFRKLSLRRRANNTVHHRTHSSGSTQIEDHTATPAQSPLLDAPMPSIESPKPVFRGIFSVQTTSTRSLKEIRSEIIRVLTKKHIEFVEVRGGFACVARNVSSSSIAESEISRKRSQRINKAAATNYSPSAYSSYNSSELAPPPSTPPSRHRRMVSDNVVASPVPSLSGSSDSIDMDIGASDMLGGESRQVSVPVRFSVDIVRVPIVSLHGIQFKKMTGNVWLYKTIAQEILEELRL